MPFTKIPTHVTSLPYGDNIALWNNRTGCHVVISKQSFEEGPESITPTLHRRLNSMYILDAALPQIELKIPHRNRNSILVDHELWSPIPKEHRSGGFHYRCTHLQPRQREILKLMDGHQNIQQISSILHISPEKLYEDLLPFMSYKMQVVQIRDRALGMHHSALLQMISPRRIKYERNKEMHDEQGATQLQDFHRSGITDAQNHFDNVEITLAHALEIPHPCLKNISFGSRLAHSLLSHSKSKTPSIVFELGAGSGAVADGFCSVYQPLRYIRMDASPILLEHQKKRVPRSESLEGYAPPIPMKENSIDLFLCNEVIADLSSSPTESLLSQKLIDKYQIAVPKEQHIVNTGSWNLLESLYSVLKCNGLAYISEFGSIDEIPEETTHLNHPEISIHFGQLEEIAKKIGFQTRLIPIADLLNISLDDVWMSKHSFMALRACYASKNLPLQARAYHPSTFLPQFDIHGLEWNSMHQTGPAPLPSRVWALLLWKEEKDIKPEFKEAKEKDATDQA